MAIDFVSASEEAIYGGATPTMTLPFSVTIPFKKSSFGSNEAIFFLGDGGDASAWMAVMVTTTGEMAVWLRSFGSAWSDFNTERVITTNTIDTSGVNVVTVIVSGALDDDVSCEIKLNNTAAATATRFAVSTSLDGYDRIGFGAITDNNHGDWFTGQIEQPFWQNADDSFAAHDSVFNSGGSVLDPSTLALGEDHRWPFNETSGTVSATDTEIDDAVGSVDLDSKSDGTWPDYAANFLTASGGGSSNGAARYYYQQQAQAVIG